MNRSKSLVARSSGALSFSVVMVLVVLSCGRNSPTEPQTQTMPPTQTAPQPTPSGVVWGFVKNSSGACIPGAVVEILDGPSAGGKSTQWDECGDVWDGGAYVFRDLPLNTKIRLRASKEGYRSQEITAYAGSNPDPSNFLLERE